MPMIRVLAFAFVSICMLGSVDRLIGEEPGSSHVLEVRIMTFNLKQNNPNNPKHGDSPNRWDLRKDIVFDVVRKEELDVIGIQEAYRYQLDELSEALPEFKWVGNGGNGGDKGEYCAILYRADRFQCNESDTFWLSDTPEKKSKTWDHFYFRICTWARLVDRKSGQGIYVFNTHFDHQSQLAREKSAKLIAKRIAKLKTDDPYILMGDLNAAEDNPVITYLKGGGDDPSPAPLVDSFRILHPYAEKVGTGNQFIGNDDGPKIDYILIPKGYEVTEAKIIRSHREGRYPSDHYPVTATVKFPVDR